MTTATGDEQSWPTKSSSITDQEPTKILHRLTVSGVSNLTNSFRRIPRGELRNVNEFGFCLM
ncbi:hypothetical protein KIN20_014523 [Parelaphostrongylus tenuis]|uniref:Uncharacterized protein n=1 Tax=Parelaphostrongylus tenuis TaxID=148309 RepID=A0AAD5QLS0_PARTN|nr:hypothetical protein KIN20_014523 [Parelaphostrongylus tenuis]